MDSRDEELSPIALVTDENVEVELVSPELLSADVGLPNARLGRFRPPFDHILIFDG